MEIFQTKNILCMEESFARANTRQLQWEFEFHFLLAIRKTSSLEIHMFYKILTVPHKSWEKVWMRLRETIYFHQWNSMLLTNSRICHTNIMSNVLIKFYIHFLNIRKMGVNHVCYTYFDYALEKKFFI